MLLGPAVSKISSIIKAIGSGSPQRIATAFAKVTPGLASVSPETRKSVTEPIVEAIEDVLN